MQNRLYNDHAALYYLLLSKWEKGKLTIQHANPQLPHPRLSLSGVPPSIPHININSLDCNASAGHLAPPVEPFHLGIGGGLRVGAGGVGVGVGGGAGLAEGGTDELIKDPNLDRYLKHGRRHTLGAAHNTILVNPEELKR